MTDQQLGITPFGVSADGHPVQRITLGRDGLCVSVLTWGAVLQGVRLEGASRNLTLGSDRLSDYEGGMRYHGSLIGPVVNRFSGARAPLHGTILRFEANQNDQHTLHSGSAGTHLKIWRLAEATEDMVRLELGLARWRRRISRQSPCISQLSGGRRQPAPAGACHHGSTQFREFCQPQLLEP